jgi:hypothetical protein
MPHTIYDTDHSRRNRRPANEMQEVSDTETVDHEHLVQDTEVSDTETIDNEPTDLKDQRSACRKVFDTTELLEHIISFLPMKKIFTIQRVSKQWRAVIATSPSIEEKMFLRLKITPKETCEPSALGWSHNGLWRLQRPPPSLLTLVSLNPELRPNPICKNQRFGLTCAGHGRRVMVQWGPTPIKQCHSLFDTYISDPPCKNAEFNLTVRFKKAACNASDSGAEYPIKLWVSYITANSDSGLTFQDVLLAALNARGQTECKDDFNFHSRFEHPGKNDAFRYRTFSYAPNLSLREVIDLLPEYTKIPKILDCVLFELKMTLLDDIAVPTPQERAELRR